jgi:hypothetical protein
MCELFIEVGIVGDHVLKLLAVCEFEVTLHLDHLRAVGVLIIIVITLFISKIVVELNALLRSWSGSRGRFLTACWLVVFIKVH